MIHRLARRMDRGERGAYLVIFAAVVVVLMGMAAIVIDLSALRQDRAANRTNADFAATAAALSLKGATGGPAVACQTAWDYFRTNAADSAPVIVTPSCASTFAGACADPVPATATTPAVPGTAIRTAEGAAGDYIVRISNPVPDGDPLMKPDAIGNPPQATAADDGSQCDRIGVEIIRQRDHLFAGIFGRSSQTTTSHSVARATEKGITGDAVALLVLEKTACDALIASGQAVVRVRYHTGYIGNADPVTDPTAVPIINPATGQPVGPYPGRINVDSAANLAGGGNNPTGCGPNNRRALDALGNQNSQIIAEGVPSGAVGQIKMWALAPGQGNARAYDADDLTNGRLSPIPTAAAAQITRAPVDHRYNCKQNGQDGIAGNSDDCPDYATQAPSGHISNLLASLGASGLPPLATGPWVTYPRPGFPDDSCLTQPSTPAINVTGNVWVNCPGGFTVNNSVTFTGGNVVFEGGLNVQGSFSMNVGASPTPDRYAVLRAGDLTKGATSSIVFNQVMVLLNNGSLGVGGGAGTLVWTAPFAGNFEDLTMWSEKNALHDLGGQANLQVEGVFFAPNAVPFRFTGQGGQVQAAAQFVAQRLEVTGQGILNMTPDPTRVVLLPSFGVALIR